MQFNFKRCINNKHGVLSRVSDPDFQYLERCSRFVKAIDARLKEIKLTRTYVTEDESKTALEVPRGRKKNKSMTKNHERGKQKAQETQDKLKNHHKKSRLVKKDKRRPKDELNDLWIVEERFFEIVEMVIYRAIFHEFRLFVQKFSLSMDNIVARTVNNN